MRTDPTENYGETKLCFKEDDTIFGFDVVAYCSPDATGTTYTGETAVRSDDEKEGAPFPVDIVLMDGTTITEKQDKELRRELGPRFDKQMHEKCVSVMDKLDSADEPVEELKNLSPSEVTDA